METRRPINGNRGKVKSSFACEMEEAEEGGKKGGEESEMPAGLSTVMLAVLVIIGVSMLSLLLVSI